MNFGIFFTCYKEIDAVDYSIKTLKENYPDCPIYLVSDGGDDYSFLETKYSNIKTSIGYDSRGILQNLTPDKWNKNDIKQQVFDSIYEFFKRNMDSIEYCKTDSILIMEPDVLVRGKLNYFPNKTQALLGSKINSLIQNGYGGLNKIQSILNKISTSVNVTHYGATPAFYNVSVMHEINHFVQNNPNIIRDLIDSDPAFACYDVFLTVLFGACGYDEIFNPDIIECLRNPNWEFTDKPLVHQYRFNYPKSGSGYDGRHANETH
jgi:hypothetical protein